MAHLIDSLSTIPIFRSSPKPARLQDGGNVDFGPLCQEKEYNCIFERVKGENSRWNPHSWFARFRKATQALGTEYVAQLRNR